jgi:hypothetical protein
MITPHDACCERRRTDLRCAKIGLCSTLTAAGPLHDRDVMAAATSSPSGSAEASASGEKAVRNQPVVREAQRDRVTGTCFAKDAAA